MENVNISPNIKPTKPSVTNEDYMLHSFGTTDQGVKVTANSPEVLAMKQKYPDISTDVAISNVLGQMNKESVQAPSILTSENARKNIQQNQQDLAQIQEQYKQPVEQKPQEVTTPKVSEQVEGIADIDTETAEYTTKYNDMLKNLDDNSKAQIQSIRDEYAALKNQMAVTNKAIQGAVETSGFRSGRSRYAPEIQTGIVGAEIKAGQDRINSLIQEEQQAIQGAEMAAQANKWTMFNQYMDVIRNARQEKQKLVQQHKDNVFKAMEEERSKMKFAMDLEKHYMDMDKSLRESNQENAQYIAGSLVKLDNNLDIIEPSDDEINMLAEQYNIDPVLIKSQVANQIGNLRKMATEERKTYFDMQLDELNYKLKEQQLNYDQKQNDFLNNLKIGEFELSKNKFNLEKAKNDFEIQKYIDSLNKESNSELTAEDLNNAVNKGYTTEAQLKLYAQIKGKGSEPITLKEKSVEQKKLEANALSGLESIDTLKSKITSSIGRGKLLDSEYKFAQDNLTDVIGRLRSGGAITKEEEASFIGLLPKFFQFESTRLNNLDRLEDLLVNAIGWDNYNQIQKERYVDYKTFNEIATKLQKEDFLKFLNNVGAGEQDDIKEYFELYKEEKLPQEKDSFNKDLTSKSENYLEVKKISEAIGKYESGGNYKAKSPTNWNGDIAYGKYQIMGNNIPLWSKEILGKSITVQEFLNNPELQDKIAMGKIAQYYDKYGNIDDVASLWFTGLPVAKAGNRKDVIGTTAPKYVTSIKSIYNKLS